MTVPPVLVTGAAGFIGYHLAERLLADGRAVVGIARFSPYYSPALKEARFSRLQAQPGFRGIRLDLADPVAVRTLFAEHRFAEVAHLAAQPGVRHALTHPEQYGADNLTAFLNVIEACRHAAVRHLVYASSSSVYGANRKLPFSEDDPVEQPISLYAATKRANELMAHSYGHLFGLPTTGLRFFTVYGPWGRPDMAIWRFTERIARDEPIEVAAGGRVVRDFTYVDDVVEGLVRVLSDPPGGGKGPPSRVLNIGGDRPADLDRVVALIEAALGTRAIRRDIPLPAGDVAETRADTSRLAAQCGFIPATPLEIGIPRFVEWHVAFQRGLTSATL